MSTKTESPQRIAVTPAPVTSPDHDPPENLPVVEFGDRDGVCPECEHEAFDIETRFDRWVRTLPQRLFRLNPKAARCQDGVTDEMDNIFHQCECRNAFHGS